jgi:hypothetical protein
MADSIPHTSTVAVVSQAMPSLTFRFNSTASPILPFSSPNYFDTVNDGDYDSVLYIPCALCGQLQHTVPHTVMDSTYQTNTVETTPIPYFEDSSFPMRMMGGRQPNHLLKITYANNKRPHRELVSFMQNALHKMIYICSSVLRPHKRYNIYPTQ